MNPSLIDPYEVLRQAEVRRQRIQLMERELEQQRYLRVVDACWLLRNTNLERSSIAAVLGISRVTLNKYLDDAGMTAEYMAEVRKVQQERNVVLYSPDISRYLASGDEEESAEPESDDEK